MNENEAIEHEIRELLTAEISAKAFSNKVFGQFTGLFPRLGKTPEQRKDIIASDLWRQAQDRFHELIRREHQLQSV